MSPDRARTPARVLCVPSRHPYIQAVLDPRDVRQVPEQEGAVPEETAAWHPSPVLDPRWIREHAQRFDIVHVHFGFETRDPRTIEAFCRQVRACSRILVVTVHDLSNPQLPAEHQEGFLACLDALVRHADQVLTLTPTAAAEIERRWGRRAVVVEHPPLLLGPSADDARPVPAIARGGESEDPGRGPARLGVLLKDARPSLDLEAVAILAEVLGERSASDGPGARLEILHHGRFRAGREEAVAALFARLVDRPAALLRRTERLDDAALEDWLRGLDALVLPYGHGTHSGLLELACDLGVPVLVSDRGHFAAQRPGLAHTADLHDRDGLARAVTRLLEAPRPTPMTRAEARHRIAAVRAEHTAIYRSLLAPRTLESSGARLSILVLAGFRYPLAQPHQGGLESHVWSLVRQLRARGHRVLLGAPEGSDFLDPDIPELTWPRFAWPEGHARTDASLPEPVRRLQDEALDRTLDWLREHPEAVDVVHHHALCARAHERVGQLPAPLVSTLHTPPLPELVEPIRRAAGRGAGPHGPESLIAVSEHTAEEWRAHGIPARTVPNGVDTSAWTLGAGGDRLCWFGRIVPEKAPYLAILAAERLGLGLDVAGPIGDPRYAAELARLGEGRDVRWHGALRQAELADLVGSSLCTLVTPVWDEPFGQVVPESLACGTPVVAVRRGGLGETFDRTEGVRLVAPAEDEERLLTRLVREVRVIAAAHRDPEERTRLRALAREEAVRRFSFERTVDALERVYRRALRDRVPGDAARSADREVRA
ncbi:glycosyltransferase [Amycolatopsis sp. H6(2020)]|nr:glycosyltransferase [Amycolatopsis sp. H6(2020)]